MSHIVFNNIIILQKHINLHKDDMSKLQFITVHNYKPDLFIPEIFTKWTYYIKFVLSLPNFLICTAPKMFIYMWMPPLDLGAGGQLPSFVTSIFAETCSSVYCRKYNFYAACLCFCVTLDFCFCMCVCLCADNQSWCPDWGHATLPLSLEYAGRMCPPDPINSPCWGFSTDGGEQAVMFFKTSLLWSMDW